MTTIRTAWLIQIRVPGLPVPQGSKRIVRSAGGPRLLAANDQQLRLWRNAIAAAAADQMNGQEPVRHPLKLEIEFRFPRPMYHYGTGRNQGSIKPSFLHAQRVGRPDLEKLVRAFNDALTGIVFVDDSQIVQLEASKRYGPAMANALLTEL